MNGPQSNAFSSSSNGFASHPRRALTSMLVAMQARQETTSSGFALRLTPLRFADAMRRWADLETLQKSVTLLIDHHPRNSRNPRNFRQSRNPRNPQNSRLNASSLADLARTKGIAIEEVFSESMILLDDEALNLFVRAGLPTNLCAVRIEGLVEYTDARAIEQAIGTGRSPLEVELRASAFLTMESPRCLYFETRESEQVAMLVGEALRHYVAALRNRPVENIMPPQNWQVSRLLEIQGTISIRPIETEVYSTSIDIGICVKAGELLGPANCSLIFDVFSNTWHDEP